MALSGDDRPTATRARPAASMPEIRRPARDGGPTPRHGSPGLLPPQAQGSQAREAEASRVMGKRSGNCSCGRERRKARPPASATASTAQMRSPARLLRQGPQTQEKGQAFGRRIAQQGLLGRCQPQRHGTAQGAGLAQQQALFRPPGRVQHAHGAPRCPAPKAEGPRTGKICQPGRELPLRRDGLSCRGQGTAHRPGVRPLRQGVVPAHAAGPASFRAISRPMTKAWRQSCGNCSSRRRRLSATEKRSALYLA